MPLLSAWLSGKRCSDPGLYRMRVRIISFGLCAGPDLFPGKQAPRHRCCLALPRAVLAKAIGRTAAGPTITAMSTTKGDRDAHGDFSEYL